MSGRAPAYDYQLAHINEDKELRTIFASGLLIAITTLAVVLRLMAQRIVKSSFTSNDYCAILALACNRRRIGHYDFISDLCVAGYRRWSLW